ncbi:hypothetical protein [Psychroserpens sp.]|uniref:hypothetical protein n=1 Tax=Psychroserpens sp. TaxID=2020870 RepID=UPI003C74D236
MKTVFTILGLLVATVSFGQANNLEATMTTNDTRITELNILVSVDSEEELESTFKMEDIQKILDEVADEGEVSFEIKCNKKKSDMGISSSVSYRISGNSNDVDGFLTKVEHIKNTAIKYYRSM